MSRRKVSKKTSKGKGKAVNPASAMKKMKAGTNPMKPMMKPRMKPMMSGR